MPLKIKSFSLSLPFGLGSVSVDRTESERRVAWALYVEYSTRIATQKLSPGQGSVREALSSLHALFDVTRSVLRAEGPGAGEGPDAIGIFAIEVLNNGVRPFLTRWHTSLADYEDQEAIAQRREGMRGPAIVDEANWPEYKSFFADLESNRKELLRFVSALGKIAGVPPSARKKTNAKG